MIFSFSDSKAKNNLFSLPSHDILCFFRPLENSIHCPEDKWFEVIEASLRLKRPILLLESELTCSPSLDANLRWQWDEHWICLQPRALSAISTASLQSRTNKVQFKRFLSTL